MSTEKALLDAAETVLARRGIQAATVADITETAGVGKGTFYLYFSTKEEVVQAVQRRHFRDMLARVAEASGKLRDADFWAVTDALLEAMVDHDVEHRDWYRKVGQGWAPPPSEFANERAEMQGIVAAAIRAGMAQGQCHAADPDVTALLLCSAIEGSLHQVCLTEAEPDRDRLAGELKAFVRKVLAAPTD